MSQIFPTPQILCLDILIYLIFIRTETPQNDWKAIGGPFEYKLCFCKARFQPIKKKVEKYFERIII